MGEPGRHPSLPSILTTTQRETHYMRFKWTPANFRLFATFVIVVPTALYTLSAYSDVRRSPSCRPQPAYHALQNRWKWRGARRGETLDKKPE